MHRSGHGRSPHQPPFFLVLQRSATPKACRSPLLRSYFSADDPASNSPARQQSRSSLTTPTRSSLVPVEKTSSVGAVYGNDSSFINKTDISVTDGINTEHKTKSRQSTKATAPGAQLLTLMSSSALHRPRCLRSQTSSGYIAIRLKRHQGHSARSPVAHFDELICSAQATLPQESD